MESKSSVSWRWPTFSLFVYSIIALFLFLFFELINGAFPSWFSTDRKFNLILSLFIFVAGILLHILKSLDRRSVAQDRRGRLMQALESSAVQEEIVTNLCEAAATFQVDSKSIWGKISTDFARSELRQATALLNDFGASRLELPNDGMLYLKKLVAEANSQIRATSVLRIDEKFWHSPEGRDYLEMMETAINQKRAAGFSIRRIFIVDKDLSKAANEAVQNQRKIGVDVRMIKYSEIEAADVEDIVIIDEEVLFKIGFTPGGEETPNSVISAQPVDVEKRAALFERIWLKAAILH